VRRFRRYLKWKINLTSTSTAGRKNLLDPGGIAYDQGYFAKLGPYLSFAESVTIQVEESVEKNFGKASEDRLVSISRWESEICSFKVHLHHVLFRTPDCFYSRAIGDV
jgi:hypothetical protein